MEVAVRLLCFDLCCSLIEPNFITHGVITNAYGSSVQDLNPEIGFDLEHVSTKIVGVFGRRFLKKTANVAACARIIQDGAALVNSCCKDSAPFRDIIALDAHQDQLSVGRRQLPTAR